MRKTVITRKGVLCSALVALVALPVLGGCQSSRRAKRTSPANSGAASSGYAMIPPAPSMPGDAYAGPSSSFADANGLPGAPTYVDPFPSGDYPAPQAPTDGWTSAPLAAAPGATAPGSATRAELEASRAELDRMKAEQAALQDELNRVREKMVGQQDEIIDSPPLPSGWSSAGTTDVPVDRAVAELETTLRTQASGAEVVRQGDRVIVRLTDGFKSGDDKLRSPSQADAVARATAAALRRFPDARVAVIGHSDSTPIVKSKDRWSSNQQLSVARAQTVATHLSSAGVGRIDVQGRGSSEPLVTPERSRSDQARNRRVEIVISL
ncbi:MAG: OmpA family protein [Planctomycetes bacterium]|nr:OmpA family protein [Planctomycetota bacterium]MCB9826278.1 OmpA family protein [Planctomycetota bacterium]MCB9901849.1 OmpA family protein [Planctomycetota bacterium]